MLLTFKSKRLSMEFSTTILAFICLPQQKLDKLHLICTRQTSFSMNLESAWFSSSDLRHLENLLSLLPVISPKRQLRVKLPVDPQLFNNSENQSESDTERKFCEKVDIHCWTFTSRGVFKAATTALHELTDTVTTYISFCQDL